MANNKNQVHLYLLDSTKERLDKTTEQANTLSKKHITRNELTAVIITEFLNGLQSDDELKDLLIKYVMALAWGVWVRNIIKKVFLSFLI